MCYSVCVLMGVERPLQDIYLLNPIGGLDVVVHYVLPIGSEEREVLGFGSIPAAILPSCQDMKTIAL